MTKPEFEKRLLDVNNKVNSLGDRWAFTFVNKLNIEFNSDSNKYELYSNEKLAATIEVKDDEVVVNRFDSLNIVTDVISYNNIEDRNIILVLQYVRGKGSKYRYVAAAINLKDNKQIYLNLPVYDERESKNVVR